MASTGFDWWKDYFSEWIIYSGTTQGTFDIVKTHWILPLLGNCSLLNPCETWEHTSKSSMYVHITSCALKAGDHCLLVNLFISIAKLRSLEKVWSCYLKISAVLGCCLTPKGDGKRRNEDLWPWNASWPIKKAWCWVLQTWNIGCPLVEISYKWIWSPVLVVRTNAWRFCLVETGS